MSDGDDALRLALNAYREYASSDDVESLRHAVYLLRHALSYSDRRTVLQILWEASRTLADRTGEIEPMREAVRSGADLIAGLEADDPERWAHLSSLSIDLWRIALATGDLEVLGEAVDRGREAAGGMAADEPRHAGALTNLVIVLRTVYEMTGSVDALREAVDVGRASLSDPGADHNHHSNLGISLRELYEHTRQKDLLTEAVAAARRSVDLLPDGHEYRSRYLSNLGLALTRLAEVESSPALLEESIAAHRRAIASSPRDHPDHGGFQSNLSIALRAAFLRTRDAGRLSEAVAAAETAVEVTPGQTPWRGRFLHILADLHWLDLSATGDRAALPPALATVKDALGCLPDGHPERAGPIRLLAELRGEAPNRWLTLPDPGDDPWFLQRMVDDYHRSGDVRLLYAAIGLARQRSHHPHGLSALLRVLHTETADAAVLAEAVAFGREAVAREAPPSPARPMVLDNLVQCLSHLNARTGDHDVLREAASLARRAVEEAAADDPGRIGYLVNHAVVQARVFEAEADLNALREAVAVNREIADLTQDTGDSRHGRALANLAVTTRMLAEAEHDQAALARAVEIGERAVAATTGDDQVLALHALANAQAEAGEATSDMELLRTSIDTARRAAEAATRSGDTQRGTLWGSVLHHAQSHFEMTGDLGVLRTAVDAGRLALAGLPDGHVHRISVMSALGVCLRMLGEWTGDLDALHEALALAREAVEAGRGTRREAGHRSDLAIALRSLRKRTRDGTLLAEEVEAARESVRLGDPGSAQMPRLLNNLAGTLMEAADDDGTPGAADLLGEAVECGRRACALADGGHRDRGMYLSNLGGALQHLYEATGDPGTLREAVAVARQAVEATPPGHRERAGNVSNLGRALNLLSQVPGAADGMTDEIRATFRAGAQTGPIPRRIAAVRMWGRTCLAQGDAGAALDAFEYGVGLLPMLAPAGLLRRDREHQLGEIVGFPSDAAAAALEAGRPERAVELLEQSRGVLLAEETDAAGQLNRLRAAHPALAAEVDASRRGMAGPGAGDRAQAGWDELIGRIRRSPGFEDFLATPSFSSLAEVSADGDVVIVNVSSIRCDALVLSRGRLRVIPLPGLTLKLAAERAGDLFLALLMSRGGSGVAASIAGQRLLLAVLGWLWDAIAEPVLRGLGYPETGGGPPRRLWWCPTNVLSVLPLHAAGHHQPGGHRRSVLDTVVSSYTTTLRSLRHARRPGPRAEQRALLVSMPRTPEATDLPGAGEETRRLRELMPGALALEGIHATRRAVLRVLPDFPIAHFACHAVSGPFDAAEAMLLLHDHGHRPLSVREISALRLEGAELAFLSACSTTATGPLQTDEGLNMAGAFQLAGYRQVIGTLWPINDVKAADLADAVYTALTANGATGPRVAETPRALHDAVVSLRDRYPATPTLWAAHIHMGA